MYLIFFVHSSVDGHLGCPHVLAIVNSAAVNTGVHVSFSVMVFSEYMPYSGVSGSYGGLFQVFKGTSILFSTMAVSIYMPFSPHPLQHAFIVCRFFNGGHSDWCKGSPHCGFESCLSKNE